MELKNLKMINLSGKVILVTGASSGLGRAISIQISNQKGILILVGRNESRLKQTLTSLNGKGHSMFIGDISNFSVIAQIVQTIFEKGYKIGGFVHSAGIEKTLPLKSSDPAVFKEVFDINVFAGFEFARLLSQKNIADPRGASFVFISSVKGKLGAPFNVAYCASKSALIAGSKAIAVELANKNIRSNCVLPGIVNTEMIREFFNSISAEAKEKIIKAHPLGLGRPEDIAALVSFLLSDEARWITGAEYIIDGGYSIS
ncbi:MAG: short-chain dehydrogenase [Flavobacterium sp.]|nr:short-chain dehydrogenase [Flavobacterium sp.]